MANPRKPQISFQVAPNVKAIYESAQGEFNVTRLCAAGLMFMLENPDLRKLALARLEWFETDKSAPRDGSEVTRFVDALGKDTEPVSDVDAKRFLAALEATRERFERRRRRARRATGGGRQ